MAEVEGDVEDVDGVLRITRIRIIYRFRVPQGGKTAAERALSSYADHCPAYQSVKDCIDVSWKAQIFEENPS